MTHQPLKIEDLFETIGSTEIPEDPVHRYELRRELLCSRYFGDSCARSQRWNRLLTFTMPLLTGGMLVVVFSFVGASLKEDAIPLISQPEIVVVAEEEKEGKFVDLREPVPMYEVIKFVPVETVEYILMH